MWISSATPSNSSGKNSIAACTNTTFGRPPLFGFLVAFIDGFSSGFTFASIPMKNLFGFARAAADTKRPSPVPMSITIPSPVWGNEVLEFIAGQLLNRTAPDGFYYKYHLQ